MGLRLSRSTFDPSDYLGACEFIDFDSPEIIESAKQLATASETETAKNCFEFVRDEVKHSSDFELNPVTCKASDVLKFRTGYCYAKAHLLCALLRANQIPAGLCYQRLTVDESGAQFCIHGLNAIYLADFGWYRVDARGNRHDVKARFEPPTEYLAFETSQEGERDFPGIWSSPLPEIISCLNRNQTWREVLEDLPDMA